MPVLAPGAGVTTSRAHIHYVVTEYGVASLHGRDLSERARALMGETPAIDLTLGQLYFRTHEFKRSAEYLRLALHGLPADRVLVTCHDLDALRSVLQPELEPRPWFYRMLVRRILSGLRRAGPFGRAPRRGLRPLALPYL
jgi:hypothetical protein